jgi:uncharacterized protein
MTPQPVSGRGSIFTFTVNRHPFNPAVAVPYVIAIVELVEQVGLRITSNLINCDVEHVCIGLPVVVMFEQAGEAWVPLFMPDPAGSSGAASRASAVAG